MSEWPRTGDKVRVQTTHEGVVTATDVLRRFIELDGYRVYVTQDASVEVLEPVDYAVGTIAIDAGDTADKGYADIVRWTDGWYNIEKQPPTKITVTDRVVRSEVARRIRRIAYAPPA